ncbi:MAG TPA: hypothetical protein VEQ63_14015 [Bryobacteraceae bacterium]|nr:hypothetical protein [Bryobacteraceae bacterium]
MRAFWSSANSVPWRLPQQLLIDHVPNHLRPRDLRAKKASAFIAVAIMGGAVLPKLMGYAADQFDMSRAFIVPAVCSVFVAICGLTWPKTQLVRVPGRFKPDSRYW